MTGVMYLSAIRAGLDREREALARGRRRDDRDRALAVAAVEGQQQVGLLDLGRHAGRRAGALDVDDHERQLGHDREADRLLLERDAGTGRAGQRERAAVGRADRRADGRDLVLGLEGPDPEVLVARQLVEDVRGGRDRVGAVEQRARSASFDAARKPRAVASLPVMLRYVPGASFAFGTRYVVWNISVVSPNA